MANPMLASDDNNPNFTGASNPDSVFTVRFYLRSVEQPYESGNMGRPIFKEVEYIEMNAAGNQYLTWDTPVTDRHRARFPVQYAAFKNQQGDGAQHTGTPLSECPFLNRAQADELKGLKFFTLENLAAASDTQLQSIGMVGGMNPIVLREKAKALLAAAAGTAVAGNAAAENLQLKAVIADMQKQIAALAATKTVETSETKTVETKTVEPTEKPKGTKSPDQRKAQSERMKARWAAKKAQAQA